MSIAPQEMEDYVDEDGEYYIEFLTFANGNYSETAMMTFSINANGQLVLTPTSEATGYLLWYENYDDDDDYGWLTGYYSLVFSPSDSSLKAAAKKSITSITKNKPKNKNYNFGKVSVIKEDKSIKKGNFTIQAKASSKATVKNMNVIRTSIF